MERGMIQSVPSPIEGGGQDPQEYPRLGAGISEQDTPV